jgi:2-amino-4-hydroxy-6-hydroxymethyldihydropteridine diphosphokinase
VIPDIWVSLGSNLGNRREQIRFGVRRLKRLGTLLHLSSLYETEPWGITDQPLFYNLVCCLRTEIGDPIAFLNILKAIETDAKREPNACKWEARTLDLDILFWGDQQIKTDDLIIPHPLIAERRFILVPMVEVAPQFTHPTYGMTIQNLLDFCSDDSKVTKIGTLTSQ